MTSAPEHTSQKRAGDLVVGDVYHWYSWKTATLISPTDRYRFNDGKGDGVYVCSGSGMPDRLWKEQMITVASPAPLELPTPTRP